MDQLTYSIECSEPNIPVVIFKNRLDGVVGKPTPCIGIGIGIPQVVDGIKSGNPTPVGSKPDVVIDTTLLPHT